MQEHSAGQAETEGKPAGLPRWLRRELLLAGILIPAGLVLIPVAIYFTGQALLGAYSEEGHGIGRLYGDILRDMGSGFLPAWLLILSPYLGIQLIRLAALPLRHRTPAPDGRDDGSDAADIRD